MLSLIPVLRSPFPLFTFNAQPEQLEMVFLGTIPRAMIAFTMAVFLSEFHHNVINLLCLSYSAAIYSSLYTIETPCLLCLFVYFDFWTKQTAAQGLTVLLR